MCCHCFTGEKVAEVRPSFTPCCEYNQVVLVREATDLNLTSLTIIWIKDFLDFLQFLHTHTPCKLCETPLIAHNSLVFSSSSTRDLCRLCRAPLIYQFLFLFFFSSCTHMTLHTSLVSSTFSGHMTPTSGAEPLNITQFLGLTQFNKHNVCKWCRSVLLFSPVPPWCGALLISTCPTTHRTCPVASAALCRRKFTMSRSNGFTSRSKI